jgi:hypothetical protein
MKYYANLFRRAVRSFVLMISIILQKPADSLVYQQLRKLRIAKLCYYINPYDLRRFVYHLLTVNDSYVSISILRLTVFTGSSSGVQ